MRQAITLGTVVAMSMVGACTAPPLETSPGTLTFDERERGEITLSIRDGLLTARADGDAVVVVRAPQADSSGEPTSAATAFMDPD